MASLQARMELKERKRKITPNWPTDKDCFTLTMSDNSCRLRLDFKLLYDGVNSFATMPPLPPLMQEVELGFISR